MYSTRLLRVVLALGARSGGRDHGSPRAAFRLILCWLNGLARLAQCESLSRRKRERARSAQKAGKQALMKFPTTTCTGLDLVGVSSVQQVTCEVKEAR